MYMKKSNKEVIISAFMKRKNTIEKIVKLKVKKVNLMKKT